MSIIAERLAQVQAHIAQTAGERPVTLVAVSKYATLPQMVEAYEAGVRHFGENKVRDALEKISAFPAAYAQDVHWHLIGSVQTNKVKKTVGAFALIQSVDSLRLAQALSRANQAQQRIQPVLLQVNLSLDPERHGFSIETLMAEFPLLMNLPGLALRGVMGIAPPEASLQGDAAELQSVFCRLRDCRDSLQTRSGIALPEISMGMTHDYVHALSCGATIIRLGNYLFKN